MNRLWRVACLQKQYSELQINFQTATKLLEKLNETSEWQSEQKGKQTVTATTKCLPRTKSTDTTTRSDRRYNVNSEFVARLVRKSRK